MTSETVISVTAHIIHKSSSANTAFRSSAESSFLGYQSSPKQQRIIKTSDAALSSRGFQDKIESTIDLTQFNGTDWNCILDNAKRFVLKDNSEFDPKFDAWYVNKHN
jgi:hypothetical protein